MDVRGFIIQFVNIFADIVIFAIFVRVILSWIRPTGSKGKLFMFLFEITEPILSVFRKVIPRIGMMDISPIVAFLVIELLRGLVIGLLI